MSARYWKLFATGAALALVVLGAVQIVTDPYGIWMTNPTWNRHGKPMDKQMRFAKSLQLLTRNPDLIFIGTSRVYRGIKASDVVGRHAYNLGITSLRIREAKDFIEYALQWTDVREIVLGLDMFMFDTNQPNESGYDPDLPQWHYPLKAIPTALFSLDAGRAAIDQRKASAPDKDGVWYDDGYKLTRLRSVEEVDSLLERMKTKSYANLKVTPEEFDILRQVVQQCKARDINLSLFISPIHQRQRAALVETLREESYSNWVQGLVDIARDQKVQLWDFSGGNSVTTVPLTTSNDFYLDTSHYTPRVGAFVMQKLGYSVNAALPPPNDFGIKLN